MISTMTGVIKQAGNRPTETFSIEKVLASVRAACLSVQSSEGDAHMIASIVSQLVDAWRGNKHAITSHDIRRVASKHLADLHPEAAYLYQHHQVVL